MQIHEARRLLGIGDAEPIDASKLRGTYRQLVRLAHPDISDHPEAGDRTARLTLAYRILVEALDSSSGEPGEPGEPGEASAPRSPPEPTVAIRLLADQSISVEAAAEETFMLLLDTAHHLGEISYLDRTAGLVEVVVEFVEAPTSSVLFSLQGRSDGTTEVFCTVEALSGGDSPPADAVTRLVLETLRNSQP